MIRNMRRICPPGGDVKNATSFTSLIRDGVADYRLGGLVGLLVGDAVGVTFEFHTPDQIPPRNKIDMRPPVGFDRSHAGVPIGTWSDDGSQALCLLASLAECERLSLNDFAGKLVQWHDHGYMAVDGDVFDVGAQTSWAIDKLRDGVPPGESGGRSEMDNGNGSLMRVLPLALWHRGSDEDLVRDAHLQSIPTHAHPRSLVACALYVLVAKGYLQQVPDPWESADRRLDSIYKAWKTPSEQSVYLAELEVIRSFQRAEKPRGTGYVVDTIWSAWHAMKENSFEDVVRAAIQFGNDTDTTAAVAGGLAGIRYGLSKIPGRWLQQLRGFDLVRPEIGRVGWYADARMS